MIINIKDGNTYQVTYDKGKTKSVPKVNGNKEYEEVKEAIIGSTEDYPTAIEVEPEFTQSELEKQTKDKRVIEIDIRLDKIDILSVRSLRSKSNGRGNQDDDDKLMALDNEAIALNAERDTLIT